MCRVLLPGLLVSLLAVLIVLPENTRADDPLLRLKLRSRVKAQNQTFEVIEKPANWNPKKTAIIICDMWDDHWCKSAARRVGELVGPLNETIKKARGQGVFIIHAPSSVTGFYKDTSQRRRARKLRLSRQHPSHWQLQAPGEPAGAGRTANARESCPLTIRTWVSIPPRNARCAKPGPGSTPLSRLPMETPSRITARKRGICSLSAALTTSFSVGSIQHVRAGPAVRHSPDGQLGEERRPDP